MKTVTRIRPSTSTNTLPFEIGSRSVSSAGPTLKSSEREADRDEERERERPAADLGRLLVALCFLGRGVLRRDAERAEADREALAERDDAADDRQAQRPVPRHQRVDRARDVRDLTVGRPHRDRPVARSAHHHALEDGLAADGLATRSYAAERAARSAFSSRRWKRSTRPPVSTSFCLPV